jgi:hypothetical protein
VGDGIKKGGAFFNPTKPPDVMADPSEPDSQPEPQGKEVDPNAPKPGDEGEGGEEA